MHRRVVSVTLSLMKRDVILNHVFVTPFSSERRKLFVFQWTVFYRMRPKFGGIRARHPGGNHSERLFVRVRIPLNILGGCQ